MLCEEAARLGLAAVGVVPADDEVRAAYPWAACVVTAAISYLPPEPTPADERPRGLVARFARSADYHTVLRGKLARLADALVSKRGPARIEICVDTCPLPERKLAVSSGIAWRGRNSCVFVVGCGSYAALGEIVVDLDLPATGGPLRDECGDCDICMRACPTGAIIAPLTLDRSRCISHLTQAAGIIPREMRDRLGNRVYGCDACQEVCPANAGVRPVTPEFAASIFPGAYPELIPLIEMTAGGFRAEAGTSSIGWIGRTRIRRNAIVAAGNLRSEEALPALTQALRDGNAVIRAHAAWALGRIGAGDLAQAALPEERDPRVIEEIEAAASNRTRS